VEESTESVVSADVEMYQRGRFGDLVGQRTLWPGVRDAAMWAVFVVVVFVLAQGMEQMRTVEDQGPVEQFVAAGLDPPLRDRVHPGYPDAAEHDVDSGVGEDGVEQGRVLAVPVADQIFNLAAGVFEVHGQVPGCLGHPGCCRVRGDAEDPDPAGGVLDDRQDISDMPGWLLPDIAKWLPAPISDGW
jgi:hypothetical protein